MPKETKAEKRNRRWIQFSKILTAFFAAIMLPVAAYTIWRCLGLVELAITRGFTGSLPYLTAIIGFVQAAVILVLGFYFRNSEKEKVARITTAAYTADSAKRDC